MSRIGKAPCSVERTNFFEVLPSDQLGSILNFARPLQLRGILSRQDLRHLSQVCKAWRVVIRKLVEDVHSFSLRDPDVQAMYEEVVLDDPDHLRVDLASLPRPFLSYPCPWPEFKAGSCSSRSPGTVDELHVQVCDIKQGAVPKIVAGASTITLANGATGPGLRVLCSWLGPSLSSLVLTHHSIAAVDVHGASDIARSGGSIYDDTLLTLRSCSTLRTLVLVNVGFEEQQVVFDDFCDALADSSVEVLRVKNITRVFSSGGSDSESTESESDDDETERELLGVDELMRMLTPDLRTFHISSARASKRLGLMAAEKLTSARKLREIRISECDLELEGLCDLLQILLEREGGLETLAIASEDTFFRSETLYTGICARMLELLAQVDVRCLDLRGSIVVPRFLSAIQTAVAQNPAIRNLKTTLGHEHSSDAHHGGLVPIFTDFSKP